MFENSKSGFKNASKSSTLKDVNTVRSENESEVRNVIMDTSNQNLSGITSRSSGLLCGFLLVTATQAQQIICNLPLAHQVGSQFHKTLQQTTDLFDNSVQTSMQELGTVNGDSTLKINSVKQNPDSLFSANEETGNENGKKWTKEMVMENIEMADTALTCEFCSETFSSREILLIHKRSHSTETFPSRISAPSNDQGNRDQDMTRNHEHLIFSCNICARTYTGKHGLRQHMKVHSEQQTFQREQFFKNDKKPHVCKSCGKRYNTSTNLNRHLRNIHGNAPKFECDICHKIYSAKAQMEIHRNRHTRTNLFLCDTCGKGYVTKSELASHISSHSDVKQFVCETCGASYVKEESYRAHLFTHKQDENKFQCHLCGKSFRYGSMLKAHLSRHAGEKNFVCEICGKRLTSNGSLIEHYRVHSGEKPFTCDLCTKSFNKRSLLNIHRRTHTGVRPYSCDVCHNTFTQRSSLVIHKRLHSGERPYVCNICSKGFPSKTTMNTHKKRHSKDIGKDIS